jgi:aspartyl-tRNA(Asn)/glutamyl-tRNA(Gln) amidotransferase subunit A
MSEIAGHDRMDATSSAAHVPDYAATLGHKVSGIRIGIADDYFAKGIDPEVRKKVEAGISLLEKLGCKRVSIRMPHTEYAVAAYYIIATAEASSNLARYDGVRYGVRKEAATLPEMIRQTRDAGFGAEVKRRILLGTYVLSAGYYDAYYRKAQQVRALLSRGFAAAFNDVDVILTPTTPTTAFALGQESANPVERYLADVFTVPADLAGIPALSVPCGQSEGLPVGVQFIGPPFEEARLLRLGHHFERLNAE